MSAAQVVAEYESGGRSFAYAQIDGEVLAGADLQGASFYGGSLREVDLRGAKLTHSQFKSADLTGAQLEGARVNASDLIGVTLRQARLAGADLTGAALQRADCTDVDFRRVNFGNARLGGSIFKGAVLDHVLLSSTDFSDTDVSSFCDAVAVDHSNPSSIDARTIIRSYNHPRIKRFMVECGVPPIFAEFMIDCARATVEGALRELMQSTFISYGGPDESFARKLYQALRANEVIVFFFPESARLGERIDSEVFRQLREHDRILLICSEHSLNRPGVLHEIRETFDRESRDGGATYLLPVTLDDYVFSGWHQHEPELAERIGRRVVGDFRSARNDDEAFELALGRLLDALKGRRKRIADLGEAGAT